MRYLFLVICLLCPIHSLAGSDFADRLALAALERTKKDIRYDGRYFSMRYPNGDVPSNLGVCTDVVIRSYRVLGIDLQKLVHEDIKANFDKYPSRRIWGLNAPDPNIDHRRVPNLKAFFERRGEKLPISKKPEDYKQGDLVTWSLPGNLPHIGIVTGRYETKTGMPMIVHNIGRGPVLENMLFDYPITGHYRFVL